MMTNRSARVALVLGAAFLACGDPSAPKPPEGVRAVGVTPSTGTLASITETLQLVAVGRDFAGVEIPSAVFTWASTDTNVATVNSSGLVTAKKNGTVNVTATTNGFVGGAVITVKQKAAAFELVSGQQQAATVGFPVDTALAVRVRDALGHLAVGTVISFTPVAGMGGGSANPAQPVTNDLGMVSAQWTLGTVAGEQQLTAKANDDATVTLTFNATAFPDEPDTMFVAGGAAQAELPERRLPAPLRVKLVDKHGNVVPDVPIVFSVQSGGGTLDSTEVLTDLDGVASSTWTLGAVLGAQTVHAIFPDSAVGAIVDLPGSPVMFTASATGFAVASVGPGTAVVGAEMTVNGAGFDPVAANNVVTVDGVAATVVSSTTSTLQVIVPSFGCVPTQTRTVSVTRGLNNGSTMALVQPANALTLAVGQKSVLAAPADFCLQFLTAAGEEEYLVGVTSTRAVNGELSYVLAGNDGVTPIPPASLRAASMLAPTTVDAEATPATRERALRDWESSFLATQARRAGLRSLRASPVPRVSAVGDILQLRVPNITSDPCNNFTTVSARVIAMGPRVTVATNATLPSDPASVLALTAALDQFVNSFGTAIYTLATTHFGLPSDLDQNERVTVLFTPVMDAYGVLTFTTAVDQVSSTVCPASNNGEMIYATILPAPTVAEITAQLQGRQPNLTHDLAHLIQISRRLAGGGFPLPAWMSEGQAELGTELAGLLVRAEAGRQDYGTSTVNADARALQWYKPRFDNLSFFFGWNGASGSVSGATSRCSLFGYSGLMTPCVGSFASGASWSFMRFVADRMAATYATGEAGFLRDLIGNTPGLDATTVLQTLTGSSVGDLMVDWAIALYVDGRVAAAAAPSTQLTSWNLGSIFDAMPEAQRLTPTTLGFSSFARSERVVGGGTAYTRLTTPGAHGALAVTVQDPNGNALTAEMEPRLWVVRIR